MLLRRIFDWGITMKDQCHGSQSETQEAIAIVGMSCHLPGGNRSPEEFFDFLLKKKCGVVVIPDDRWDTGVFFDPNSHAIAKSVSKWGGFVEGIRNFDAKFFGISPREAAGMDPQQRMVLQSVVEAMFDAQIPLEDFTKHRTGVFIGISQSEYRTLQEMRVTSNEAYAGTGYALCITANRVSHRLNLNGPSYAVDTACSSSLTALNQAVQNLRTGTCDIAVVGGVNALTHPSSFLAFSKAGMISPTGQISTFDASANGFVRGEGVGTVIIKTLRKAQIDGDRIHAVIHGTAVNQDGATNTITAPNQTAQISMLRNLFNSVDITPDQIGFVEAHGTGTPIGDPIEAGAIGTVIGQNSPDHPVFVGSSKANVGHLESGAGITGLIKAAMAVKTGIVPPNIHFKDPNPHIPFDALNLRVPTKPEEFPDTDGRRYAVVNSFGFGGANACALISSAPDASFDHHPVSVMPKATNLVPAAAGFPFVFPLSGATPEALQANAGALLKAMGARGKLEHTPLRDISAALATKRSHFMYRAVILVRTEKDLKSALRALAAGKTDIDTVVMGQIKGTSKLCFTFSGQGSQWWAMARNLLEDSPVFSDAVDAFDAEFLPVSGWSIREELAKDKDSTRIDDTTVTQPALFAIQSGLAALWKALGVEPDMVAGHSIGEAAASYVAGGLSLSGAAKFLSKRGTIRDQLGAKGAMAAIGLNHVQVEALLPKDGTLGIAAINGPGSTTISGDFDALHVFVDEFQITHPNTFIRTLTVDTAWHSHHLDAGEAWFCAEMASIDWAVPTLPFISTVTGQPETRFDTDYGWLNLRKPVRFQAAVETALSFGTTTFIELGPAGTLAGPTKSTALEAGANVTVLHSINRKDNDFDAMAHAAATLFVEGHPLRWRAITGTPEHHVPLPAHVWIEEEFWQDSEESRDLFFKPMQHPFLGFAVRGTPSSWMSEINLRAYPYLKDHRMQSEALFPAAGYLDTMIALCRRKFGAGKTIELENAIIHEALFMPDEQDVLFSNVYDPERKRIKFYSRARDIEDEWVLRSESTARVTDVPPPAEKRLDPTHPSFVKIPLDFVYDEGLLRGFVNYGDTFQTIKEVWMSQSKTYARLALKDTGYSTRNSHHLHPTLLDGCLQLLDPNLTRKAFEKGQRAGDSVTLPVGCGRIRVYADFPDEVIVEADQFKKRGDGESVGFTVYDLDGNVLVTVTDMRVKFLPAKKAATDSDKVPAHFVRQEIVEIQAPVAPETPDGTWIVLEDESPRGAPIGTALETLGANVRCLPRASLGDNPGDALVDVLGQEIEDGKIAGIVVTWPLTMPDISEDTSVDVLFDPLEACTKDLISLGELLDYSRAGTNRLPNIVVLTSGAYPDGSAHALNSRILSQMPLASLVRGLSTETPEYAFRVIDADAVSLKDANRIAEHILTPSAETEMILRDGFAFAPRLVHVPQEDFAPKLLRVTQDDIQTNFHATMQTPGVIDNVELAEIPLVPVGEGEVRVRIAAVGLNFRDIMAVTGLLPAEAEPEPAWRNLGLEFGGIVETVGDGVTQFKPGDRVMGLGRRCLQRFMTTDARALTLVPDHISLAEASTIPSAFATAHYALNHIGRMRKGDKVFIHVATGGVGTAAVQLAQAAGAEIFATAGSPEKRRILRQQGIPHVMDSRTLKFADDVMRITKGTGVDVLLNSLPGDYITKGLDIMAPYGRYLEIGKRDVYEDASIGMKALRRNVSLSVLDLAAMGLERPDLMSDLFAELSEMLDAKTLAPLPLTEFPISRISDAIRYMSQAKHVGKVVVSLEEDAFEVRRDVNRPVSLLADGSYLITGGTSGFSLSVADWLSRAGAGHLVLASRSGTVSAADEKNVARMRKRGTDVSVIALDITKSDAVSRFVNESLDSDRPLKGVVHGAAVIKDGLANQLTSDMITDALSPKVKGAWNLHRAFAQAGAEPDFMIGFSSIAQVVGSAGQCNYIAANAFLDALAAYRTSLGRCGTAIDWGVIADAGFVTRNAGLASYLESVGQFGLVRKDADRALECAIARDTPTFLFARADWAQVARANPALGNSPRMSGLLMNESGGATQVRSRLMVLDGPELVAAAEDYIKDEITSVLKIDKTTIQSERPMSELGLDSLSSFELKVRIETALDTTIPVSKFLQAPSIAELAIMLSSEINGMQKAEAAALEAGDASETAGAETQQHKGVFASNLQMGLMRDCLSPRTSEIAKTAMEHHSQHRLVAPCDLADLAKVLRQIEKRHPLLTMRMDANGHIHMDGPGITLSDGIDARLLNVAQGELVRVCYHLVDGQPHLDVRLHSVVGDRVSADILGHELEDALSGKPLARPVSYRRIMSCLGDMRYDPETPMAQRDRSFWWYALSTSTPNPVPFAKRSRALLPAIAGRNHGAAKAIDVTLPFSRSLSAVLCAFAHSVRQATASKGPMIMGRKISLRSKLPDGAAIGPFEIEQPLLVPHDRADGVALAQFERILEASAAHTAFDSSAAAEAFSSDLAAWNTSPFQILVEPVDALSKEAPNALLHDLWLQVKSSKDQTQMRLIYDEDVVTAQTAQAILEGLAVCEKPVALVS